MEHYWVTPLKKGIDIQVSQQPRIHSPTEAFPGPHGAISKDNRLDLC
jgi:hypothetical protein